MQKRIFIFIFIIFTAALFFFAHLYKDIKVEQYKHSKYKAVAKSLESELDMMIKEKQNITLSIAISLSHKHDLAKTLTEKNNAQLFLKNITDTLKDTKAFQNVWIQLVGKDGVSLARNWDTKHGDNISSVRQDIASMLQNPMVQSSISIGRYNLSFKAMVPIYDLHNNFVGCIEVVTHFNSIAEQIKEKGYEPLIVVAEEFKEQLEAPFTNIFVHNHYIANSNVDPKYTDLVATKSLNSFVSPDTNHLIYEDLLVFNYPIVDNTNKLLANFLIFIPLETIDTTSIKALYIDIILFSLSVFVIGSFSLLFLYKTLKKNRHATTKNYLWVFILFFLIISGFYSVVLHWYFEHKKNDFLNIYNKNISRDFEIINTKFTEFANSTYTLIINKSDVTKKLADAYLSKEQKAEARRNLYLHLQKEYAYMKEYGVKQLHFQLKNNESFLRFHRPLKYGDNLSGVRPSVEYVNKNLIPLIGFEEGRIFNAFRHVYPLLSLDEEGKQVHLGSVEISFGANTLLREFIKYYGAKAGFLMSKAEVEKYVFENEKSNYEPSVFDSFLYEVQIQEELTQTLNNIETSKLDPKDIENISKEIYKGKIFSHISNDCTSIFTFIPLPSSLSKKIVATIILQENTNEIALYKNQFYIFLLFGITTIFFALLYIYREFSSRQNYQALSKTTQNILDAQDTIVVVTNGNSIINVNKKFFDFFGITSLEKFREEYQCICYFFEQDSKFFHLGHVKESHSWIDALLELPSKFHIVSMKSKLGIKHSFAVLINSFDEDYVISFSDISARVDDYFSLELKVTYDTLTNAYSRDFFYSNSLRFIEESIESNLSLGLIVFDIDHFKSVNDTYGHNTGDTILKHLVKTVQKSIRMEDILVRWGGEEFILLAKTKSLDDIKKMANFIRLQVEKESFVEVNTVTCSFGVTLYKDGEDIQETIQRADMALYEAKNAGRNCVIARE